MIPPAFQIRSQHTGSFFFFNLRSGGVESRLGPLGTSVTSGLLYLPRVIVRMENFVEWRLRGKPKYPEKTYPSATPFTTNPTWPEPGAKGAAAVRSQRLTTGAMTRPTGLLRTLWLVGTSLLSSQKLAMDTQHLKVLLRKPEVDCRG
jgi:hypothetical protein